MQSKLPRFRNLALSACLVTAVTVALIGCGAKPSVIDGLDGEERVALLPSKYFTNTSMPVNLSIPRDWSLEAVGSSVVLPEELTDAEVMAAFAGPSGERVILFRLTGWRPGKIESTVRKELDEEGYFDLDDPGDLFSIAAAGLRAGAPNQLLGIGVAEAPGFEETYVGVIELIRANSEDTVIRELVQSIKSFRIETVE